MEDRMLSDEILLGIINSKSGGGGGGTTDYSQLENKPQIGGVTLIGNMTASELGLATETALADKADKSAVKNEFLGTLEEWNALTVEQRKAYDTYQIKGDYAEGSGGLPDYSTTEQKTGQKWIDGKDIYCKTVILDEGLTIEPQIWTSCGLSGANISTIINAFGIDDNGTFFTFNATPNVSNTGNYGFLQTRNTSIKITKFVMFYTKTT